MKTSYPPSSNGRLRSKFLLGFLASCLLSLVSLLLTSPSARAVTFTSQLVTNFPATPGGLPADSNPSTGAAMGGYFYFAASDGTNGSTGRELWRTDGTPGGTALVKDICPGAGDSSPQMIVAAGTNLFFVASDGIHGQQLWKSDGTPPGTVPITSLGTNAGIYSLYPVGNGACYTVTYGNLFSSTNILFRTDGTVAGTFPLNGPGGVVSTNYLYGPVDVSGTNIVFATYDYSVSTYWLWSFNGTGPYTAFNLTTQTNPITDIHLVGTNCCFICGRSNYNNYCCTYIISGHTCYVTNFYTQQLLWRVNLYGSSLQLVDTSPPGSGQGYFGPACGNSPGYYDSEFSGLTVANGRLYYTSFYTPPSDYTGGPWKSLGQSGSPVTISSTNDGASFIGSIGANAYYWKGGTAIYRTDGVSAPVVAIDLGPLGYHPTSFQQVGARFFFQDETSSFSYGGLGVTDLTPGGTYLVPGPTTLGLSSYPGFLGALGNLAIYNFPDPQLGNEPYRSDGAPSGTFLLKDIAPGISSSPPATGVASGGLFYFPLPSSDTGLELWRSDGTAAGTFLLKDINPGTNGSSPNQLTPCNGLLYFTATDGSHGQELWRSDGTAAGTYMVKDIRLGGAGSNPTNLVVTVSQLFFVADDGSHGAELWASDGTSGGTYLVQDIQPGIASGHIHGLGASAGEAHFMAGTNDTAGQLWFSTATPGGAQFLYDFGQVSDTSFPRGFTAFNGKFYFSLFGYLMATDDTPGGTAVVVPKAGNEIITAGGRLFTSSFNALLTSDGTAPGTVVLATNLPGVSQLTPLGAQMYFASGAGLWSSDGTTNGTLPVAQYSDPSQAVANLTPFQGALIFSATSPALGHELWATAPGQGATLIEDLSPQTGGDNLQLVSAATNQVFYVAKPAGQTNWQLRTLHLQSLTGPSGPYGGTPWPVPGLIEAENYDLGGDGFGYHDLTADNEGAVYRPYEGVDLEPCNDTNGGFCIFNTRPGEWVDYTVNAAYTGIYQIEIRMTCAGPNGLYHFEIDGVPVNNEGVYNNGTPGSWVSIIDALPFYAGVHVLRVVFDQPTTAGDVGLFNYFNLTALETNQPPVVFISAPPAGGIVSTSQPVVLAAKVIDSTTWSPPIVQFFVDGQSLGTVSNSPYTLPWTPTPGPHTASAVATDSFGTSGVSSNLQFFVAEPIFPEGSSWRVNAFGTNVPNSWHNSGYDDSHWPRLRAPLGFGYPDIRSLVPSNFNGSPIPTFYFRTTFTTALSNFNFASLTLTRDDAAVVWLNGQLLARVNLPQPPTNVVFTNLALTNVVNNTTTRTNPAVDILPMPTSMLLDGTNLLAIEIHQGRDGGLSLFDLKFDLSFSTFLYTPAPVLNIFGASATNNGGVTVQWPDSLTNWTLEHSLNLTNWNAVTGTPIDTNGFLNLNLTPPLNGRDFFRLHNTNAP